MRVLGILAAAALIAGMPAARLGNGTLSLEIESAGRRATGRAQRGGLPGLLPRLRAEAQRAGISRATLDRVFPTLTFSPRTVELDRAQPGGTAGIGRQPALCALSRPPHDPVDHRPRPLALFARMPPASTISAGVTACRPRC